MCVGSRQGWEDRERPPLGQLMLRGHRDSSPGNVEISRPEGRSEKVCRCRSYTGTSHRPHANLTQTFILIWLAVEMSAVI